MTPEQVAGIMQVTPRTVYNWLRSSQLPAMKVGRTWRVSYADIEAKKRR